MLVPRALIHKASHITVPKKTAVINLIFQEIAAGPDHVVTRHVHATVAVAF